MIGSFVTAGIGAPSNVPLTITLGNLYAGANLADSNIFIPGNEALLIDPGGTNMETVYVKSIVSGANNNQIVLGPKTTVTPGGSANPVTEKSHVSGVFGTGTWILVKVDYNSIFFQPEDGNAGAFIYIGNDIGLSPTNSRIIKLAKVASGSQPNPWSNTASSPSNPFSTAELWVIGGASNNKDGYTVSLNQV